MLIYIILGIFVHYTTAQYDCRDFLDEPVRNITIYDAPDDVIDVLYINDIEDVELEDSANIEANVDNNYLIISKTATLEKLIGDGSYATTILLKCEDNDYKLEYNINAQHCRGIEFDEPAYSFSFYGYMEEGDEINLLAFGRIAVKCSIGPEQFVIEENEYFEMDNETNGIIIALKDISPSPTFNETFTILGWDSYNGEDNPVTTTVQIIINPTYAGLIAFTDISYYGYIDSNLEIVIENGPIALETDIDISDVYIEISSEYASFFDVQYAESEIILVPAIESNLLDSIVENDTITLMVTAYDVRALDNSAVAFVMLDISPLKAHDNSTSLRSSIPVEIDEAIGNGLFEDEENEEEEEQEKEEENQEEEEEEQEEDKEENEIVDSTLGQFNFWASNMMLLISILMVVSGATILISTGFIVVHRIRMSRRKEMAKSLLK